MDLEEMKERWAALNDRLERTEMLQESVIRELVQTKGEKSVSRLINWETFGFVVTILIIPYSIYVYHRFGGHFAMWDLFIRVAIVVDGLLVLWTGYKLYGLMKIDFTKVVKENILRVNRYTVQITREKIFTAAIIGPLFVILSVVMSIEMKAPDFIWGVLFGVVVATTVACYWLYKRVFDKNIRRLQESLAVIEEVGEEE
ncbi:hypothetical protein [Alistipes indistinctus]|jgi:hypothetical protein|uniref:hypothetical protein n=1 Tax=Alistipes indistinctus TaxID=626932 RepID=UPI0024318E38